MAFRAAACEKRRATGVIAAGGDIPPELSHSELKHISAAILARGKSDPVYAADKFAADRNRLLESSVSVRALEFEGGHEWGGEVAAAAAELLRMLDTGSVPKYTDGHAFAISFEPLSDLCFTCFGFNCFLGPCAFGYDVRRPFPAFVAADDRYHGGFRCSRGVSAASRFCAADCTGRCEFGRHLGRWKVCRHAGVLPDCRCDAAIERFGDPH
jgi:hypothetical protein